MDVKFQAYDILKMLILNFYFSTLMIITNWCHTRVGNIKKIQSHREIPNPTKKHHKFVHKAQLTISYYTMRSRDPTWATTMLRLVIKLMPNLRRLFASISYIFFCFNYDYVLKINMNSHSIFFFSMLYHNLLRHKMNYSLDCMFQALVNHSSHIIPLWTRLGAIVSYDFYPSWINL